MVDDGLGRLVVEGVDEERAHRLLSGQLRAGAFPEQRVDLGVRHGPDEVRDRLGECPERRQRALAVLDVTRVAHEGHHDGLAVGLRRQERQRRRKHDVRDRRELLGSGRCLRHEGGNDPGLRREDQRAAKDRADLVQPEPKARRDTEVAAPASDRPEEVRVRLVVHLQKLAVGGHKLGRQQVVDRETVLPDQEPDAAAEREPADSDRPRIAEAGREAVRACGDAVPPGR